MSDGKKRKLKRTIATKRHETTSDEKEQNIGRNACTQRVGMEGTEPDWTKVQAARTRRKRRRQGVKRLVEWSARAVKIKRRKITYCKSCIAGCCAWYRTPLVTGIEASPPTRWLLSSSSVGNPVTWELI